MEEKRTSKRIPYTDLPLFFKTFNLEIGKNKSIEAKTIDASTNGIAFTISDSIKDIKVWESVTMNSKDGRFKFFGNVVYISNVDKDQQLNRLGVKFI